MKTFSIILLSILIFSCQVEEVRKSERSKSGTSNVEPVSEIPKEPEPLPPPLPPPPPPPGSIDFKLRVSNSLLAAGLSAAKITIMPGNIALVANELGEIASKLGKGKYDFHVEYGKAPCIIKKSFSGIDVSEKLKQPIELDLAPKEGIVVKFAVLNFDPIYPEQDNKRLHEILEAAIPRVQMDTLIEDVGTCSQFMVNYKVVSWEDIDGMPKKIDGFTYSKEEILKVIKEENSPHQPDAADFVKIINDANLFEEFKSNKIDKLLLLGPPYAGFGDEKSYFPGPSRAYLDSAWRELSQWPLTFIF